MMPTAAMRLLILAAVALAGNGVRAGALTASGTRHRDVHGDRRDALGAGTRLRV